MSSTPSSPEMSQRVLLGRNRRCLRHQALFAPRFRPPGGFLPGTHSPGLPGARGGVRGRHQEDRQVSFPLAWLQRRTGARGWPEGRGDRKRKRSFAKRPSPRTGSTGAPPLLLLKKTLGARNAKARRPGGALRWFKKVVGELATVITGPPKEAASLGPCGTVPLPSLEAARPGVQAVVLNGAERDPEEEAAGGSRGGSRPVSCARSPRQEKWMEPPFLFPSARFGPAAADTSLRAGRMSQPSLGRHQWAHLPPMRRPVVCVNHSWASHGPGENNLDIVSARVPWMGGRDHSPPSLPAHGQGARPLPTRPLRSRLADGGPRGALVRASCCGITLGGPAACLIKPRPASGGPPSEPTGAGFRTAPGGAWASWAGPPGRPGKGAGAVRVRCVLSARHLQGPCKGFRGLFNAISISKKEFSHDWQRHP